jgi:cyclic pyranopterin phosphate synthase
MPAEGVASIRRSEILRYEEFVRICRAAVKCGIKTVRVTGGEPLARKDCIRFLKDLKSIPGLERVTLTTNGVLLAPYAEALAEMGLDGVNISLDSLDADTFMQITGRDEFAAVWDSLQAAIGAGLRVKVNCVPISGVNDTEIEAFARLTEHYPIDVRFIEFMPSEAGECFRSLPTAEILERLRKEYPDMAEDRRRRRRGSGPALYYKSAKMRGAVGLIAATSHCFCAGCNRIRVTSEGFLKLCLYHGEGIDLRSLIRNGADDSAIEAAIAGAILRKPERHFFGSQADSNMGMGIKNMSRIGG